MLVNIADIKVKKRVRKDLGDLEPLKDSLKNYGLLNPITINTKFELIAGERRLECAKILGWQNIEANVVAISDRASLLEMELEENTVRKPFDEIELLEGYAALEKLRHPSLFKRILDKVSDFFTGINETSAERRETKIKRSLIFAMFIPAGMVLIIIGAILFKTGIFSSLVRTFTDLIAIIMLIVGILFLTRHLLLKRNAASNFLLPKEKL